MFKKIRFILFFALILLLCTSCAQTKHEPVHPNKVSFANLRNGGEIVECENGYIYHENGVFYKMDLRTDTVEPIAKALYCSNMNLYNDCLYYTYGEPGLIWKMSMDGKKKPLTFYTQANALVIYKDHMYYYPYYTPFSAYFDAPLVRVDLNGGNRKELGKKISDFCIINDRIYCTITPDSGPKLCSMKTDGTDVKIIKQAYATELTPIGNKLFYSDYYREDKMFIYDLDTDTEVCICEDRCGIANSNEEWIFYTNKSDNGNLYKIRPDGSDRQKILDMEVSYIHVIGDRLLYKDSYWNRPADGTWDFKYIEIE